MLSTRLETSLLSDRETIAKGSKSFYLASLFFTPEQRRAAWNLYRWCRACDDHIDQAPSHEAALARLAELRSGTSRAIDGWAREPEFAGLRDICSTYAIPREYPLDLLQGMQMDVAGHEYRTLADVELYSYRVAGVVGLMICHVTGTLDPEARDHAVAMGVAMQLTNIARDVKDDFALGRIYLPATWLKEAGVDQTRPLDTPAETYSVVIRLLDQADHFYSIGYNGLRYLPFRAALAVSIAGSIYSAIGTKIRRRGPRALNQRTFVSFPHKLWLIAVGTVRALKRRSR